jgi:hypothetical protein
VAKGFTGCGDCVAVEWANHRRTVTATLTATPKYPPWPQVLAVYKTQNPTFDPAGNPNTTGPGSPADGGMDIQTWLEYVSSQPGPDGVQAVGFAAVDFTDAEEVQAAIAAGGVLIVGVNVQADQETQFSDDEPWNWVTGSAVEGGHCTAVGGYGPPGAKALGGDERFITWAQETSFTDSFWANGVEELWFVVWPEQLGTKEFQAGIDEAAFAAEYTAITGKPFPVPVTPPAPVPPVPVTPPAPVPPVPVTPPAPAPPGPVTPPVPVPPVPVTPPDPVPPVPEPPEPGPRHHHHKHHHHEGPPEDEPAPGPTYDTVHGWVPAPPQAEG